MTYNESIDNGSFRRVDTQVNSPELLFISSDLGDLAQLQLAKGDTAAARWASRKGLLASPGYEILYRDLMLACEVDDDLGALNAIMAELNALFDTVDPLDNLESETRQLYERIRGRRKPVA